MDKAQVIEAMSWYDKVKFTVPKGWNDVEWSRCMNACNLAIANFKLSAERLSDKEREKLQKTVKKKGGMR